MSSNTGTATPSVGTSAHHTLSVPDMFHDVVSPRHDEKRRDFFADDLSVYEISHSTWHEESNPWRQQVLIELEGVAEGKRKASAADTKSAPSASGGSGSGSGSGGGAAASASGVIDIKQKVTVPGPTQAQSAFDYVTSESIDFDRNRVGCLMSRTTQNARRLQRMVR